MGCVGQVLCHYKILEPIRKGGMGEVYLAQDFLLDRIGSPGDSACRGWTV